MAGESRYNIHLNAYIKLVLHSLKHKNSAVNGILIGRVSDARVEIIDSVPLFHSHHINQLPPPGIDARIIPGAPQPPLDNALRTIKKHYKDKAGLSIVGYLHANGLLDRDGFELNRLAKKIADHLSKDYPIAGILLLDYNKLEVLSNWMESSDVNMTDKAPVMQLYTKEATSTWKKSVGSNRLTLMEPSANDVLQDYIYSGKSDNVFDFDDHLNDVTKDWRNSELFK